MEIIKRLNLTPSIGFAQTTKYNCNLHIVTDVGTITLNFRELLKLHKVDDLQKMLTVILDVITEKQGR